MRKHSRIASLAGVLSMAALLSACAVQQDPYGRGYQQQPQTAPGYGNYPAQGVTEYGRVASIEGIPAHVQRGSSSGVGAVLGAVVGGVLGNQVGGGLGRAAATAAGAVGGAYLGNTLEGRTAPTQEMGGNYRILIQLDRGGQLSYDVPHPGDLRTGDRVRVTDGQISRY